MLKIRKEQSDALSRSLVDRFVRQVVSHLEDDLKEYIDRLGIDDGNLEDFVRLGMEKSKNYGIVFEEDIERYIECMVVFGPDFDHNLKYPWAENILNDKEKDGEQKVEELSWFALQNWQEPES